MVLNDSTSTTLDSQETSDLEDNVWKPMTLVSEENHNRYFEYLTLRSSPAGHLTGQADTNDLRSLQLPGSTDERFDSVRTTHTDP